jgi:hypothetical protein
VLLIYGAYLTVRSIVDLAAPANLTGQVLWKQVWRSNPGGENRPPVPWLHYLAVDDGSRDRTTAWGLPSGWAGGVADGDTVRMTARRWSRRVTELTVVAQGTGRRWQDAGSTNHEALVLKAMNRPEPRSGGGDPFDAPAAPAAAASGLAGLLGRAIQAPAVPVANLLTEQEVGSALGLAVTAHPLNNQTVQSLQFRDSNGRPALNLMAVGGLAAQMAVRTYRRGQPLPGIGDEAFAGDRWAVGRHGDTVVTIALSGAGRNAEARNVHWLLATAVGRLTAAQPSS